MSALMHERGGERYWSQGDIRTLATSTLLIFDEVRVCAIGVHVRKSRRKRQRFIQIRTTVASSQIHLTLASVRWHPYFPL